MKINFIDLQAQYQQYKHEIDAAIHGVLDSSHYILGEDVAALENELAAYTGAPHCITCSSGTDALLLALMAIDLKPGEEVITSPFTFFATAETIALLGGRPAYVDIDDRTYNLDPALIEKRITPRTRAIIPVSIFGQPPDMDEINALGERHGLMVIEDAAQSFGATYKGKRSCNLSTIACTSFFPAKPLGCYGDGGAVFTRDEKLAQRLRSQMNHGQTERYKHGHLGINGRMDTIQAAVLRVKLRHLDAELQRRTTLAERYGQLLADSGLTTPFVESDRTSVYAQYSVRSKNRDEVIKHLSSKGVPTAIHYPIPLYRQDAVRDEAYGDGLPVTERVTREIMSLPMSPFLTEEQQDHIAAAFRGLRKVFIHPTAAVTPGAKIGDGTKVWINSQIRENVTIGANCIISKDTYIDLGVTIGNNCKLQNGVSVYHGVTLEDDIFVGPYAVFTNDHVPRAFNAEWKITPTLVKKGASIGANATIVCGVTIGEYAMVAAGSVVTHDVEPYSCVIGSPARHRYYVDKTGNKVDPKPTSKAR